MQRAERCRWCDLDLSREEAHASWQGAQSFHPSAQLIMFQAFTSTPQICKENVLLTRAGARRAGGVARPVESPSRVLAGKAVVHRAESLREWIMRLDDHTGERHQPKLECNSDETHAAIGVNTSSERTTSEARQRRHWVGVPKCESPECRCGGARPIGRRVESTWLAEPSRRTLEGRGDSDG